MVSLGNTQLELSGVEHRRRRNLYGQHLVGKSLQQRIPAIERLAHEMIAHWDTAAAAGSDFVHDHQGKRTIELGKMFANEFPIRVVCEVLGFPKDAQADFYYWYNSMMTGLGGSATHQQGVEARQHLEDYVAGIVGERRQTPTLFYTMRRATQWVRTSLASCARPKSTAIFCLLKKSLSNIALIVGGGGETTRGAIMNLWCLLLRHPDQLSAVLANEAHWDRAFHETLRHSSSIGGQPRQNSFDIEMHGVRVPAGSLMQMVDFSANHDERIFASPEAFNIFRSDLYCGKLLRSGYRKEGVCSHMAFGVGPHLCPGAWISHQEAVVWL